VTLVIVDRWKRLGAGSARARFAESSLDDRRCGSHNPSVTLCHTMSYVVTRRHATRGRRVCMAQERTQGAKERKEQKSVRLSPTLLEELARHAREAGSTFSSLVERYVDEGIRRDEHPLIVFRDAHTGRRAALVGSRLDVWQVIQTVRNSDNSVTAAAEYLEIPETHVRACLRYYAFYRDEIDAWIERMHAIADREYEAWSREEEVLA
jgi:uncharacterized protein (DUF433 family)